jgi:predicted transcriptional regulator
LRKPDLFVMARFLDALHAQPDGRTKGDLQRAVRVNYDIFRDYLAVLETRGLARRTGTGRKEAIHMTDAGREARLRLLQWVEDVLGGWP